MKMQKPHICFVAPAIFPVFSGDRSIELVGGAEVQQSVLARTFARAGYRVSIVTRDFGQPDGIEIDGVRIYRAHSEKGGIPGLRFFYPRATRLWKAMQRADADIYYQSCSGMLTGLVGQFCRSNRRHFVFVAASDADFYRDLPLVRYRRDQWLYRRGIRMADILILQNEAQMKDCQALFARSGTIVPSCHECLPGSRRDPKGYVLWVANMRRLKRPELFIEIARRLPYLKFRMVGGPSDRELYQEMAKLAATLPNIEFCGYVPFSEMHEQFNGARVLVNTSEFEGFPVTFMQAWACGIPVVSFFDTGDRFDAHPVLQIASDIESMTEQVAALMCDEVLWRWCGDRSRACYRARYTPEAALLAYEACFSSHGIGEKLADVARLHTGLA
jgi:glycosyltransferase involved in cell wall biosynthesis